MNSDKVVFISVIRDQAMYDKCLKKNPHVTGNLVAIDNTEKNESIPICYNKFLNSYRYEQESWLVFCHEDFEPLEEIQPLLYEQDHSVLYGPIGAHLENKKRWLFGGTFPQSNIGSELESNKDGSLLHTTGNAVPSNTVVDTFDCQCLIVHSSLINQHKLRFDENLTFDLYVEDFCANANDRHGIKSKILPFKCHHWSYGCVTNRYLKALHYLDGKYKRNEFPSTVGYTFGAGRTFMRRKQRKFRKFLDKYLPSLTQLIIKVIS